MKIILAIDSFKGCLSSLEAEAAAATGIKSVFPHCLIQSIPVADGGEGLLDVIISNTEGKYITLHAHNPLLESIETRYGITSSGTAIIEMATINGLPLVAPDRRNPMLTSTYGTGELIKDALERGCREFIIGIGGSATNDAGLGMLQALGFQFLDKTGQVLGLGGQIMNKITQVDRSQVHPALAEAHFTVACDVHNPFYGPQGAASIFARQKGATDEMIRELDAGMQQLAKVIKDETGKDIAHHRGAGAAGGMGGGMLAFLHAELKAGIELLFEAIDFQKKIEGADLIFTGEGKIDRQTIMGKVPHGVLKAAAKQQIPVIAIAGSIEDSPALYQAGFKGVFSIVSGPISLEEAMKPEVAKENIKRTVEQICSVIR